MSNEALKDTTLISYNQNKCTREIVEDIKNLIPIQKEDCICWFNTYGEVDYDNINAVISKNKLDDFLLRLMSYEHTN